MTKVWAWLKKNWMWVLFPIGILMVVGLVLERFFKKDDPISTTTDKDADTAVDAVIAAGEDKDAAIAALEKRNLERLARMSKDQQKEYEEIKARPIEEVASWIDKL